MSNPTLNNAIAPALHSFYSLVIAFVIIAALSAFIAVKFGGKNRPKRQAIFGVTSLVCFLIYLLIIFPRISVGHA